MTVVNVTGRWAIRCRPRVIKAAIATALSFSLSGSAVSTSLWSKAKAHEPSTSDNRAYSLRDYMPVRLERPAPGAGHDEVYYQLPAHDSYGPFVTWTMLVWRSGRVEVIGNHDNWLREFWTLEGVCKRPSSKGLGSTLDNGWQGTMFFDVRASRLDASGWYIRIGDPEFGFVACSNLPEGACQQWLELANHIAPCKETIGTIDSNQG